MRDWLMETSGKNDLKSFLFRGQADPNWNLVSSFDRTNSDKSKYDELLKIFRNICQRYNYNEELLALSEKDENLLSAYGQHYGLPTRLLDWTTSPYFAVFFALSSAELLNLQKNESTIWILNKESKLEKRSKGLSFIELSTNKFNYRIKNQLGHFTRSFHSEDSIDDYEANLCQKDEEKLDDLLWRIDLVYNSRVDVLSDLEDMGITFSIAYPDIEGYINESIYKLKQTQM